VQEICRAFDVLPGPTGIVAEGCWLYANPALLELAGRALVGTPAIDIDARRWRRADGSTVAVEVAARSIELDGRTACVLAISDRSASEQLSERLAQSEDSFRAMLDASPDAMFVHGDSFRDYQVLWANAAMLRLLGYDDLSELVGRASLDAFVHPDDRDVVRTNRIRLQTGGAEATLAFRWVTRAGQVRHVSGTRRRLQFGGQSAILVIARDRTEELEREHDRAAAEAALRESEARYRLLFDGSPVPICVFDAQTFAYVAVNQKMLDTYGYTREEFLRMTVKDVKPAEDLPDMIGSISASPVGEQRHIGVRRHRRKDGAMLDMDITSHQLSLGGQRYSLAIGMDVTEQRRIEDQLRQAAKMEAIGQLAGGVAHDFNNLLAVILATTEFLRDGLGAQHALAGEVNEIESAAQRAARLTRQLLAFSRKQPHTPKVLALRGVVGEIEKMLRRILGEDIDVVTRLAPCGQVAADAGQLEQVLMNLAVNARDAMPRGGRLVLETTNVELDASRAVQLGLAPGPYAVLAVTDSGCGMSEATRRRIFEPFFTTKEVGRGTGLGLATVFGIVQQNSGAIAVDSEPGRGSTFRVYLPRVDRAETTAATEREPAKAVAGSESVLVVEDDPQLRAVILRRLRSLGYRTLDACDASTAIDTLAADPRPVDLLLTDLVMPGIDGRALASRLLADRPELKVLFMSGYSEHVAVKTSALGPADHFIAKPFSSQDLSAAVRRALTPVAELA
jgi:hypothetical protein